MKKLLSTVALIAAISTSTAYAKDLKPWELDWPSPQDKIKKIDKALELIDDLEKLVDQYDADAKRICKAFFPVPGTARGECERALFQSFRNGKECHFAMFEKDGKHAVGIRCDDYTLGEPM